MIKFIWISIAGLLFNLGLSAQNLKQESFHYSGDNWGKYDGHRLTLVVLDTSVGGSHMVAEHIIKGGKFDVSGVIQAPQNAFFGLYNPNGDFVYKQEFILEPGKLQIDRDEITNNIKITGGKYNPLFATVKNNPALLAKQLEYKEFTKSLKQDDFKDEAIRKKVSDLQRATFILSKENYDAVRNNNPDPMVKLLAIYSSTRDKSTEDQLNQLEKQLGALPEIVYLKYTIEKAKKRAQNMVNIQEGSDIKNFSGKDLDGNTVQLSDVLKKNKYTLVEFWASWCGPCRGEIPHMKKAYERFKDKGFEILSFTLDHERDRWIKASSEENLPWINIGDLLAYKSPVVNMFGITGIPANYLVDPNGKVVAVHLRQEKLDEKLSELLK